MESRYLLHGVVLVLSFVSVNCKLLNVTFTNNNGEYVIQSPGFPSHAPAYTNYIWQLNSPPGTKLSLKCDNIQLLKRIGCTEGSLTIWDGTTQFNLCSVLSRFQRESNINRMFLQFRAGVFAIGKFRCVASVKKTDLLDELEAIDSREHGQGVGARSTSCPCGWTNKQRIVGGRETLVHEYVFPVSIKHWGDKQGFCGGSIISPRHILTAAHCVYGINKPLFVVTGEHDFNTNEDTNATEIIRVQRYVMHENYDHKEMTHDIALLVLTRDIKFNQFVGPVCLPTEPYDLLNKYIKVLGWGMTSTNGNFSNVLQKVDLKVVPLRWCASRYSNTIDLKNPTQICTFANKRDSCQGDSGGPLIFHDPEINRYVQVALVSYGKECASEDPAVNIEVYKYYNWIQETIRKNSPSLTCEKV